MKDIPSTRFRALLRHRRFLLLTLLLVALLAALIYVRRTWLSEPVRPPASASDSAMRRYWVARIQRHPADSDAYLNLGLIEEKRGFFYSAIHQLQAARQLGAPDRKTAGPMGRCWLRLARFDEAKPELERAARTNADSAEAAIDFAALYSRSGRPDAADQVLHFFLEHHPAQTEGASPADWDGIQELAVALAGVGDEAMALRLAAQLERIRPKDPAGFAIAGKELLAEDPASASKQLRTAVKLAPSVGELHTLLGESLARQKGLGDEAIREWQRALDLNPQDPRALDDIGHAYASQKKWKWAAIAFLRATTVSDPGVRSFQLAADAAEHSGQPQQAAYLRGRAALTAGDYATAQRDFIALAATGNAAWRREALLRAAEAALQLHHGADYFQLTQRAAVGGSASDDMELADAYGETRNYAERVKLLARALQKDPTLAGHVHHELGTIAVTGGRFDDAEAEFQRSIAADPGHVDSYRQLAKTYLQRRTVGGRLQKAIETLRHLLTIDGSTAQDWELLGVAYESANRPADAEEAFEHSIDLQPGYGPSYLELGQLYARLGEKERGETMLKLYRRYESFDLKKQTLSTRALSNRSDAGAQLALGDFYADAGAYARAAPFYERAAALRPTDPAVRQKLATAYFALGRSEDAATQRRLAGSARS